MTVTGCLDRRAGIVSRVFIDETRVTQPLAPSAPIPGAGRLTRGVERRKVGQSCPTGTAIVLGTLAFRMGQRGAAPGRASPPTGSPRNSVWTECHPHVKKCGRRRSGAAGAGSRQAGPSGPRAPSEAVLALVRWTPGQSQVARRRPARRPPTRRRAAPWATAPAVMPRTAAPAAAGTEFPPLGQALRRCRPPSYSGSLECRAPSASCGTNARMRSPEGTVPHRWGSDPCQRRVQGIEVGSDGAEVPENPLGYNGKSAPTGGAGG